MGSSREYWLYARQCADWAKEAQTKDDQEVMMDMAKAWVHLAMVDIDVAKIAHDAMKEVQKRPLN
jgi:hypothetical protein